MAALVRSGASSKIEDWFEGLPYEWRGIADSLRNLILEASPLMTEEWKYGIPFYVHRRWLCYLSLQKKGLVLGFVQGVHMSDTDRLFAVSDHKQIRHYLPSTDPDALPLNALRRLMQEAIALNDEIEVQRRAKFRKRS